MNKENPAIKCWLPVLKPKTWGEDGQQHGVLIQPLFSDHDDADEIPCIAYGDDRGDNIVFARQEDITCKHESFLQN